MGKSEYKKDRSKYDENVITRYKLIYSGYHNCNALTSSL